MTAPTLAQLWAIAQGIREDVPILSGTTTDADCIERAEMISEALRELTIDVCVTDSRGVTVSGRHVWHSVLFEDGTVAGRWCDNEHEAALDAMVWYGKPVRIAAEDPDHLHRNAWKAANGQTTTLTPSGSLVPAGGLLDALGAWA